MNTAKIISELLNDYKNGKYRIEEVFGDPILVNNTTNEIFVPDSLFSEQFYETIDKLLENKE